MSGYDAWKLRTPEDDSPLRCPECGVHVYCVCPPLTEEEFEAKYGPEYAPEEVPPMTEAELREADFEMAERNRYGNAGEYWSDEDAAQEREADRDE